MGLKQPRGTTRSDHGRGGWWRTSTRLSWSGCGQSPGKHRLATRTRRLIACHRLPPPPLQHSRWSSLARSSCPRAPLPWGRSSAVFRRCTLYDASLAMARRPQRRARTRTIGVGCTPCSTLLPLLLIRATARGPVSTRARRGLCPARSVTPRMTEVNASITAAAHASGLRSMRARERIRQDPRDLQPMTAVCALGSVACTRTETTRPPWQ
mmetsp:Transcript_21262/g.58411  ORF Transcript_21262/g.58411 Transcript_21262/m.58411 type:complete len:210 (-) Transcript_21262:361-990(-)